MKFRIDVRQLEDMGLIVNEVKIDEAAQTFECSVGLQTQPLGHPIVNPEAIEHVADRAGLDLDQRALLFHALEETSFRIATRHVLLAALEAPPSRR